MGNTHGQSHGHGHHGGHGPVLTKTVDIAERTQSSSSSSSSSSLPFNTALLRAAAVGMQGWRPDMQDAHDMKLSVPLPIPISDLGDGAGSSCGTPSASASSSAASPSGYYSASSAPSSPALHRTATPSAWFFLGDGHGSEKVAKYAARNLLTRLMFADFSTRPGSGSAAASAAIAAAAPVAPTPPPGGPLPAEATALVGPLIQAFVDIDGQIGKGREGGGGGGGGGSSRSSGGGPTSVPAVPDPEYSGTTAVAVVLTPSFIHVANAGDSRAILLRGRGGMTALALHSAGPCGHGHPVAMAHVVQLTVDHKPSIPAEKARICAAGGFVVQLPVPPGQPGFEGRAFGPARVNGELAVSRALGDFAYKNAPGKMPHEQPVSPVPDVTVLARQHLQDRFVVIACDGVWDVMTPVEVAQFVWEREDRVLQRQAIAASLESAAAGATGIDGAADGSFGAHGPRSHTGSGGHRVTGGGVGGGVGGTGAGGANGGGILGSFSLGRMTLSNFGKAVKASALGGGSLEGIAEGRGGGGGSVSTSEGQSSSRASRAGGGAPSSTASAGGGGGMTTSNGGPFTVRTRSSVWPNGVHPSVEAAAGGGAGGAGAGSAASSASGGAGASPFASASPMGVTSDDVAIIAADLTDECLRRGSRDNISVILVALPAAFTAAAGDRDRDSSDADAGATDRTVDSDDDAALAAAGGARLASPRSGLTRLPASFRIPPRVPELTRTMSLSSPKRTGGLGGGGGGEGSPGVTRAGEGPAADEGKGGGGAAAVTEAGSAAAQEEA
jgi:serine/threonine protein phosphatase PrpC